MQIAQENLCFETFLFKNNKFLILFSPEKQETGFLVALPLVWSYDALIIFSEH